MSDLEALSVVCSLSSGELRNRLSLIQALTREALRAYTRDDLELTLYYAAEAADRVRAMVAGEQQCCAFLRFSIAEDSDGIHVMIRAPEQARDAADELFAQFIAELDATMTP